MEIRPNKVNVLFIWEVKSLLKQYLKKGLANKPNINLIFPEDITDKELLKLGSKAQIIIGWRPTKKLIKKAINLKVFINPGAGVQHLIPLFQEVDLARKVKLINGHGNAYFTAQHGVALLLSLTNKIVPHHIWMQEGKWRLGDEQAKSIPLRNRNIGFLGYGHVNRQIHNMLKGFTNNFFLKRNTPDTEQTGCVEFFDLTQFLQKTEVLICAIPATSKTENLISQKELETLGKDGIVVNLSRGNVFNENDLFNALKSKTIFGAAIDVWYNYKPEPDADGRKYPYHLPFHELENVILSPHRAASPFDDLNRWDEVIENISRFADGKKELINVVNLEKEY